MAELKRTNGFVAPGYESVKALFEDLITNGKETNAQLCVYVKGEKVIDLWGTSVGDHSYNGDSIQTCFSSTKTLTAICIACMVDRGLLDYEEKVSKYWPEFAKHGKGDIKVCDVLRHEAGLVNLKESIEHKDVIREEIKKNAIGKIIEETKPIFSKKFNSPRAYHSITRGWILNEIFRRVEPKGRTVGEFLYEEINQKLGVDVNIGITSDQINQTWPLECWSISYVIYQSLLPLSWGRKVDKSFLDFFRTFMVLISMGSTRNEEEHGDRSTLQPALSIQKEIGSNITKFIGVMNENTSFRTGEMPSINGMCSARGFARLAACILNGGQLDGVRILKEETVKEFMSEPIIRRDSALMGSKSEFTKGGVNIFRPYDDDIESIKIVKTNRENYVGWMGLGGSVFQWHPELQIGFGWVTTLSHWYDLPNSRGAVIQAEVSKCVRALNTKS